MERLNADEVLALAAAGEGQTIEYKQQKESQTDISALLVALANADGGIILFGVGDDGTISGVDKANKVEGTVKTASRNCQPSLATFLDSYPVEVEGKTVLVVQLLTNGEQVYSYKGVHRRRQGSENVTISGEALHHLLNQRSRSDFDMQPCEAGLAALDEKSVNGLLRLRAELITARGEPELLAVYPTDPASLEQLTALGAVVMVQGGYHPTMAGLLVLGQRPQQVIPHAVIKAAAFSEDGITLTDRAEFGGSIGEQVRNAQAFVAHNTRLGAVIGPVYREDQPEYPLVAVREALINALVHREYTERGAVSVYVFFDHLKIVSPGKLMPGLDANHLDGKHQPRNAALARLAYFNQLVETLGTGVIRMRQAMRKVGQADPEFAVEGDWLTVVFRSQRTGSAGQPLVGMASSMATTKPKAVGQDPLAGIDQSLLNPRQIDLLTQWVAVGGGEIKRADYETRYDVSRPTAQRDLVDLLKRGLVGSRGSSVQRTYYSLYQLSPAQAAKNEEDEQQ